MSRHKTSILGDEYALSHDIKKDYDLGRELGTYVSQNNKNNYWAVEQYSSWSYPFRLRLVQCTVAQDVSTAALTLLGFLKFNYNCCFLFFDFKFKKQPRYFNAMNTVVHSQL